MPRKTMKPSDAAFSEDCQRELAAGVLKQAAQDLRRFRDATNALERDLFLHAYSWIISDDYSWPFSFQNVCNILNRAPDELRQELVGEPTFGRFGRRTRRYGRTLRRFFDSLTKPSEPNLSTAMPPRLLQPWH